MKLNITRIIGKNFSLLLKIMSEINCATISKVYSMVFCQELGVKYRNAFCSPLKYRKLTELKKARELINKKFVIDKSKEKRLRDTTCNISNCSKGAHNILFHLQFFCFTKK
jgi:hypothetical protein